MASERPHVVVHTAVSLDGATGGFDADIGTFYELAATWREDVTLTGADTILAQEASLASAPQPGPASEGPLLAVVDGRARVSRWTELRNAGHWSDVLAISCERTDRQDDPPELVVGRERVDLRGLLAALGGRPGVRTVRVDSGGALTGALLSEGLVDEISLLVHPVLVGAGHRRWYGNEPPAAALTLDACRSLPGGLVWLRHLVARE